MRMEIFKIPRISWARPEALAKFTTSGVLSNEARRDDGNKSARIRLGPAPVSQIHFVTLVGLVISIPQ